MFSGQAIKLTSWEAYKLASEHATAISHEFMRYRYKRKNFLEAKKALLLQKTILI